MARQPDPFKPKPGAKYSKGQVNRAGRFLAAWAEAPPGKDGLPEGWGVDEVIRAFECVTWWREQHARPLSNVAAGLRYHVEQEDALIDGRVDVTQRLKRRITMITKLNRERGMNLARMNDIAGVRVRLPDLRHLQLVSRRLRKSWTVEGVQNYIATPKSSGYRALHLIVKRRDWLVEVQLRTVRQDAWANRVEDDGRRLGAAFKFGAGDADVLDYYRVVAEAFAELDEGREIDAELRIAINEKHRIARDRLRRLRQSQSRLTEEM